MICRSQLDYLHDYQRLHLSPHCFSMLCFYEQTSCTVETVSFDAHTNHPRSTKNPSVVSPMTQQFPHLLMARRAHFGLHLTAVDPALLPIARAPRPPPTGFAPAENLELLRWAQHSGAAKMRRDDADGFLDIC